VILLFRNQFWIVVYWELYVEFSNYYEIEGR